MTTRKSKIFGNKELELLENRIKNNKKDKNNIWRLVKPKVIELLNVWIPRKKELEKTIKSKQPAGPGKKTNKGTGG